MLSANKTFDVFFSYAHADKEPVEYLANKLQLDFKIWLDLWELVPGNNYRKPISKGLEESRCCAVFLGQNTPSQFCDDEIDIANILQKRDENYRIIPVLLPNANKSILDGFLEIKTWVSFEKGLDDPKALHMLRSGIRGEAPGNYESIHTAKLPDSAKSNAASTLTATGKAINNVDVEITLDRSFESLDERLKHQLLDALGIFLNMGSNIVIKNIRRGSVIVTIELEQELAEKLAKAIDNGMFADFQVTHCRIIKTNEQPAIAGNPEIKKGALKKPVPDEYESANPANMRLLQSLDTINQSVITQHLTSSDREKRISAEEEIFKRYSYFITEGTKIFHLSEEDSFSAYSDTIKQVINAVKNGSHNDNDLLKSLTRQVFKNKAIHLFRKNVAASKIRPGMETAGLSDTLPHEVNTRIEDWVRKDELTLLKQILNEMNENCRQLILLHGDGYSDEEIAEKMSYKSANVVRVTRRRCMEKLRNLYEEKKSEL